MSESANEKEERRSAELQVTDIGIMNVPDSSESDSGIIYKKPK